jgi:ABC-type microcin C transport system permease subunit YejE
VKYQGRYYFPMLHFHNVTEFGQTGFGEPDYRALKKHFAERDAGDWVLMTPYPYGPNEALLDLTASPPNPPTRDHPFGTDDRGRDVLVRLAYGFNISLTFALMVLLLSESVGVAVGAALGYFGGKLDILGQRIIEIWSSLPFLYTIIIISSIIVPVYMPGRSAVFQPSFWLLVAILHPGRVLPREGARLRRRSHRYRCERARHHVPTHPSERPHAGGVLRAVRRCGQHQRSRRA